MFIGPESSIKNDFLKMFPVPISEFISHLCINIIVFRELSELSPRLAAAERIRSNSRPEGVSDIVFYFGVEEVVAVGQTVEREEGKPQGLMNHELRQAYGRKLMKPFLFRETRGQALFVR